MILVPFPFADMRAAKTRPALVVNDPSYEAETGNLIIAQITSGLAGGRSGKVFHREDKISHLGLPARPLPPWEDLPL